VPYLSASAVMIHYEEALYQVHGPLSLPLKMMEMVVTTGAIRRAKFQSYRHHQNQQTNTQHFTARCPFCRPTNSIKALKREINARKQRQFTFYSVINTTFVFICGPLYQQPICRVRKTFGDCSLRILQNRSCISCCQNNVVSMH